MAPSRPHIEDRVEAVDRNAPSTQQATLSAELERAREILEDPQTPALDRLSGEELSKALLLMESFSGLFNDAHTRLEAAAVRRDDSPRRYENLRIREPSAVRSGSGASVRPIATDAAPHPTRPESPVPAEASLRDLAKKLVLTPSGRAVLYPIYQIAVHLHALDKAAAREGHAADQPRPSAIRDNLMYKLFPDLIDVSIELHERRLRP